MSVGLKTKCFYCVWGTVKATFLKVPLIANRLFCNPPTGYHKSEVISSKKGKHDKSHALKIVI